MGKYTRWIVGGALALAVILVVAFGFIIPQGVTSAGNKLEATLSASYSDGANYLSNCSIKSAQAANVANAEVAANDKVFADAIAGRYNSEQGVDKGKLFSAIHEAYPNLTAQDATFQNVLVIISGCQDDFRNKQSVVLDQVRAFNSWRTGSWTVRTFGGNNFPNDNLVISVRGVAPATGTAALAVMREPLVSSVASSSYQSGFNNPTNPFATTTAPAP